MLLILILVLRIKAGLPTVYQCVSSVLHFFKDDGVYEFKCAKDGNPVESFEFRSYVPQLATWALVDSNASLVSIPTLVASRCFVVQASSPRPDGIAWTKKAEGAVTWHFMKPWTISELCFGYAPYFQHL